MTYYYNIFLCSTILYQSSQGEDTFYGRQLYGSLGAGGDSLLDSNTANAIIDEWRQQKLFNNDRIIFNAEFTHVLPKSLHKYTNYFNTMTFL